MLLSAGIGNKILRYDRNNTLIEITGGGGGGAVKVFLRQAVIKCHTKV